MLCPGSVLRTFKIINLKNVVYSEHLRLLIFQTNYIIFNFTHGYIWFFLNYRQKIMWFFINTENLSKKIIGKNFRKNAKNKNMKNLKRYFGFVVSEILRTQKRVNFHWNLALFLQKLYHLIFLYEFKIKLIIQIIFIILNFKWLYKITSNLLQF